ncbi:DnaA ATPase domain-containing protein, partial [Gemmatimonadota bacterium]
MELTASELWSRILEVVQAGLPEQAFRTWLAGTHPAALSDRELLVEAPSQFHVEWLEDKYGPLLEAAVSKILGRHLSIAFTTGDAGLAPALPTVELSSPGANQTPRLGSPPQVQEAPPALGLNHRYTFTRFVVGGDNQLAAAACLAVAEKPALMYNPLFLYGGVGLGKTHLMHAIGNAIVETNPRKR